ncbi:DUF3558 family protein [Actinokineospora sp. NPDC004072]
MRKSLLAIAAATAALAVACSTTTPGDPVRQPASGDTGSGNQNQPTTAEQAGDSPLAAIDPCDLLTASGRSAMEVTGEAQDREQGGARYCQWRVRKGSVADSYTIAVGVWERVGVGQAVSDRALRPLQVNSREAVEGVGVGGASCFVALAVTETSRVDAAVVGDDGEKLCPVALELAQLVEPELP